MKTLLILITSLLLVFLGSSCERCEICTRTTQITRDGQLRSTSVSPYEFCGTDWDFRQEENTSTSTTTRSDGSVSVWTTTVVCD
ncbi:MAG: hypothetical protein AAF741_01865 [Bacteroidota bacterium]